MLPNRKKDSGGNQRRGDDKAAPPAKPSKRTRLCDTARGEVTGSRDGAAICFSHRRSALRRQDAASGEEVLDERGPGQSQHAKDRNRTRDHEPSGGAAIQQAFHLSPPSFLCETRWRDGPAIPAARSAPTCEYAGAGPP